MPLECLCNMQTTAIALQYQKPSKEGKNYTYIFEN